MPPKKSTTTKATAKDSEPQRRSARERKSTQSEPEAPAEDEKKSKSSAGKGKDKPAPKKSSAPADKAEKKDDKPEEKEETKANAGKKRSAPSKSAPKDEEEPEEEEEEKKPAKKQKTASTKKEPTKNSGKGETIGSKHDDASADHGQPGSASRLPSKGQKVTWKALPGWVHGTVVEIVTSEKDVKGKHVKGSKKDPRIALQAESGKFCVHKPDACFF